MLILALIWSAWLNLAGWLPYRIQLVSRSPARRKTLRHSLLSAAAFLPVQPAYVLVELLDHVTLLDFKF